MFTTNGTKYLGGGGCTLRRDFEQHQAEVIYFQLLELRQCIVSVHRHIPAHSVLKTVDSPLPTETGFRLALRTTLAVVVSYVHGLPARGTFG